MTLSSYNEAKNNSEIAIKLAEKLEQNYLQSEALCSQARSYYYLHRMDEAKAELNKLIMKKWHIYESKVYLGRIEYYSGRYEEALKLFNECLEHYKTIENNGRISNCLQEIARVKINLYDYDSALQEFRESIVLAEDCGLLFELGRGELGKATISYYKNEFEEAKQLAYESLDYFERISNNRYLIRAYNLLGMIHHKTRKFKDAEEYFIKALDYCPHDIDYKVEEAIIKRQLARLYIDMGLNKKAFDFFGSSADLVKEINLPCSNIPYIKALAERAIFYLLTDDLLSIKTYTEKDQENDFEESYSRAKKDENEKELIRVLVLRSLYYAYLGKDLAKMVQYFKEAVTCSWSKTLRVLTEYKNYENFIHRLIIAINAEKVEKGFLSNDNLEELNQISDDLFSEAVERHISQMTDIQKSAPKDFEKALRIKNQKLPAYHRNCENYYKNKVYMAYYNVLNLGYTKWLLNCIDMDKLELVKEAKTRFNAIDVIVFRNIMKNKDTLECISPALLGSYYKILDDLQIKKHIDIKEDGEYLRDIGGFIAEFPKDQIENIEFFLYNIEIGTNLKVLSLINSERRNDSFEFLNKVIRKGLIKETTGITIWKKIAAYLIIEKGFEDMDSIYKNIENVFPGRTRQFVSVLEGIGEMCLNKDKADLAYKILKEANQSLPENERKARNSFSSIVHDQGYWRQRGIIIYEESSGENAFNKSGVFK